MVRLDRVQRRFGRHLLFTELSWRIPPGDRVGLVGPNGAGKTTLLRLIAGHDRPDCGEVHVPDGFRVGYLPQEVESLGDGAVLDVVLDGLEELREIESRLEQLERRMSSMSADDPEIGPTTDRYGALRQRFEILGGDDADTRARRILSGLGIPRSDFTASLAELSGGWRMRVALARLLVGSPGVLLLDEPTNHLDLEALSWLEAFLADYEGAFVVVSHDRYFLNRMVRGIVELDRGRLDTYRGNYDDFVRAKAARDELQAHTARREAREIARIERFVERFRYKASKARQVQARIRALDKRDRTEAPRREAKRVRFGFPTPPRSGDVVFRAEGLSKSFGEKSVYRSLDLIVRRGDRIALIGPNGAGKSTLLKLVAGVEAPSSGTLDIGHKVAVEYYAQHQLEALDPADTVLGSVEAVAGGQARDRLRTLLGSFLFSGDAVDKRVAVLSGGEKARLALCRMLLRPANLLVLDEPTNHLDLAGREMLEEALNDFDGTLIFVSHDRYFMNRVATSIGEVGAGSVSIYPGDYDTFLERGVSGPSVSPECAESAQGAGAASDERRAQRRDAKRAEAEERNRVYREQKGIREEIDSVEREIAALEAETEDIDRQQTDPDSYRDGEIAARLGRRKLQVEELLEELYRRWERLALKI